MSGPCGCIRTTPSEGEHSYVLHNPDTISAPRLQRQRDNTDTSGNNVCTVFKQGPDKACIGVQTYYINPLISPSSILPLLLVTHTTTPLLGSKGLLIGPRLRPGPRAARSAVRPWGGCAAGPTSHLQRRCRRHLGRAGDMCGARLGHPGP